MKRQTRKTIRWINKEWTHLRVSGTSKYLRKDDSASVSEEQCLIVHRAGTKDQEIERMLHEAMHVATGFDDDESGDEKEDDRNQRATEYIMAWLIANGVDLSPITEGFE